MIFTTTFVPNDLTGSLSGYAGTPRIARAGGVRRAVEGVPPDAITVFETNETGWYGAAPATAVVGAARSIALGTDIKWRGMFRFLLRENTIDQSSILSGSPPQLDWWQYVTNAEFRWFNGDPGGAEAGIPPSNMSSDLLIYGGRGLYSPTGGQEGPFGRNDIEGGNAFGAAQSFGALMATLAYNDWALPTRTYKSLTIPASVITSHFRTVTGDANAFFDVAFVVFKENVDGVNFKQEFAAYGGFQPMLVVTFDIPPSPAIGTPGQVTAITDGGSISVTALLGAIPATCDTAGGFVQADTGSVSMRLAGFDPDATTWTPVVAAVVVDQMMVTADANKGEVSVTTIPFAADAFADVGAVAVVWPSGDIIATVPL